MRLFFHTLNFELSRKLGKIWWIYIPFFVIITFLPVLIFFDQIVFDPVNFTNEWVKISTALFFVSVFVQFFTSIQATYYKKSQITTLHKVLIEIENDLKKQRINESIKIKYGIFHKKFCHAELGLLDAFNTQSAALSFLVEFENMHNDIQKRIEQIGLPNKVISNQAKKDLINKISILITYLKKISHGAY